MADRAQQEQYRMPLLEFLTRGDGSHDLGDGVVIGFAMIIEMIDPQGERGLLKLTSDASGHPLPYYHTEAFANALDMMEEFDDALGEES